MSNSEVLEKLCNAVIQGDEEAARATAELAVEAGIGPGAAIEQGLKKGIDIIGERWSRFECFLPEVMMAVAAMKAGMSVLLSRMSASEREKQTLGTIIIGTVVGDIHDIGKNIVSAGLSAAGFQVHDIGIDVQPRLFIEKAEELKADFIALSCLLTPSMYYQKDVIEELKARGIRDKYYVVIGGGPITSQWVREIGADGYGKDYKCAVEVCKQLADQKPKSPLREPVIKE